MPPPPAGGMHSFGAFRTNDSPHSFRNFGRNIGPRAPTFMVDRPAIVICNAKFDYSQYSNFNFLPIKLGDVLIVKKVVALDTCAYVQRTVPNAFGHTMMGWVPTACFALLVPGEACDCLRAHREPNCLCIREGSQREAMFDAGFSQMMTVPAANALALQLFPQPMIGYQSAI
ncbi:hypothetical protein VTL71DRAFT_1891 [Oculimacula yallundae]|uniref:Uncharacterized protein n=1 Tax=Oculimacula yallundae TaxID=86028 RepID=A0ABR4CBZ4_9HELO